ncbi:MAG: D-alanyl-D-alanine carboxypeptidase family protein [Clostridia bacterium]
MRKITVLLLFFILLSTGYGAAAKEGGPEIKSASAILMQADTGRIMFEKDADAKAYPASTTKIMTALLAIENLDPAATLTVSETAIQIDRDGSNMGLLKDEVLTVEQLLYGLLVHSANDAANVLAEAVAGDIAAFVDQMNARAAELGMTGTHFVNAHGYHDEEHYTTARDMLKLASCAMGNPLFRTIVATATYEIPPTNKYKEPRILSNNNSLINPMRERRYVYSGAAGIKTGHTSNAGSCLVSYAERKGLAYYCVTLNAPVDSTGNYSFLDSIALFDYGFNDFSLKTVSDANEIVATREVKWGKGDEQAILYAKEPLAVLLPNAYDKEKLTVENTTEEHIVAPVKKGDILGRMEYFYDGVSVGSVDLVASRDVPRSYFKMIFGTLWNLIFNVWVITPLAVVVLILILRSMREAKKQRLAREQRRQQIRRSFYQ